MLHVAAQRLVTELSRAPLLGCQSTEFVERLLAYDVLHQIDAWPAKKELGWGGQVLSGLGTVLTACFILVTFYTFKNLRVLPDLPLVYVFLGVVTAQQLPPFFVRVFRLFSKCARLLCRCATLTRTNPVTLFGLPVPVGYSRAAQLAGEIDREPRAPRTLSYALNHYIQALICAEAYLDIPIEILAFYTTLCMKLQDMGSRKSRRVSAPAVLRHRPTTLKVKFA